MKKISIDFNGYWTNSNSMPSWSGVYCVYRGKDNGQSVAISQLLYVGESENVHDRIQSHERLPDWKRCLQVGEALIFSAAPITVDRVQAEAAIINFHKPKLNTEYRDSFPFGDTEMTLTGRTAELTSSFRIQTSTSLASLFATRLATR